LLKNIKKSLLDEIGDLQDTFNCLDISKNHYSKYVCTECMRDLSIEIFHFLLKHEMSNTTLINLIIVLDLDKLLKYLILSINNLLIKKVLKHNLDINTLKTVSFSDNKNPVIKFNFSDHIFYYYINNN